MPIYLRVDNESVIVVGKHQYLAIAKEFRHQHIRAIVDGNSPKESIVKFLEKPSVIQLDWKTAMQEDDEDLVSYVWLVFFFERALNPEEQKAFEEQVVAFYRKIRLPTWAEVPEDKIKNLNYPYCGYCVEFQAYLPIEDERWYPYSAAVILNFHCKYVPIVSFQGNKFSLKSN